MGSFKFQQQTENKSHIGRNIVILFLVLLALLFFGAFIFKSIEETAYKQRIIKKKSRVYSNVEMYLSVHDTLDRNELIELIESVVDDLSNIGGKVPTNVTIDEEVQNIWTFESAFYFCFVLVTTIGYGDMTPITDEGKVVCVIYGLCTIPIFFTLISLMCQIYGSVYKHINRALAPTKFQKNINKSDEIQRDIVAGDDDDDIPENSQKYEVTNDTDDSKEPETSWAHTISLLLGSFLVYYMFFTLIPASFLADQNGMDFITAQYFCFVTFATVGFGDHTWPYIQNGASVGTQWATQISVLLYLLIGLSFVAHLISRIGEAQAMNVKQFAKVKSTIRRTASGAISVHSRRTGLVTVNSHTTVIMEMCPKRTDAVKSEDGDDCEISPNTEHCNGHGPKHCRTQSLDLTLKCTRESSITPECEHLPQRISSVKFNDKVTDHNIDVVPDDKNHTT